MNDFNSSIRFDQRMIAQDMRGSGVHATMLAKQGIISEKDCEDILNGLASIADDLASGKLEIDPNAEDVHTFVEQSEKIKRQEPIIAKRELFLLLLPVY